MVSEENKYRQQISNVSMVYNTYRIILPLLLLTTYFSSPGTGILGILNPEFFIQLNISYAIAGLVFVFAVRLRGSLLFSVPFQLVTLLIDVLAISLLAYTCGGIISGLGLLLIVTIASASILLRGRISTFVAAVAALAVLYSEIYLTLSLDDYSAPFLQAGILGVLFFLSSLYVQSVNNRVYEAAQLAEAQAHNIIDLEKLNNEIIQRMRTGIVVVNRNDEIVSINNAAQSLMSPILKIVVKDGKEAFQLPEELREQINSWQSNNYNQSAPIALPKSNVRLQTNFAYLNKEGDSDILVFVEDQMRMMQRIRQTKLASLGRLTANIAHEVRNPLGAISHASQILLESDTVSVEDRRLLEIILRHSERVNRIIQDVLDASRHRDIAPITIQLEEWLNNFIQHYRDSCDKCDEIKLNIASKDNDLKIIPSQLERVLTNLLDNGLRYSEKATGKYTIQVEAGVKVGDDGQSALYISVIDEGPGLSHEEELQLFEPFHTTEVTGTGLGLYISKELCEANQATLDYSVTDKGTSCFTISFANPHQGST